MCGRFKLSAKTEALYEHFDIHGTQIELPLHFNISPTQAIAVIRTPHQLELLRWGLKLPNPKSGGINVRVESLAAPMYREAIRERRCLILADGFYEWKAVGKKKQPYLLQRRDHAPFAFAGLWQSHLLPNGELIDAAAILTTAPRGRAAEVHDRMPLILPDSALGAWLDPNARYRDLLEPDAAPLDLLPVSPLVNSPSNDDPRCAEPVVLA